VNPGRRAAASSAAGAAECLKFSEYPGRNLDDDGMGILVLKLTKGYQQSNQEIPGKLSIVVPTAHLERYRSGKDSSMIPACPAPIQNLALILAWRMNCWFITAEG